MKPINKEQEQYIANIKGICEAISKNLEAGKTPQEIAEMFGATNIFHDTTQKDIDGYEEYLIDFKIDGCEFGITLFRDDEFPKWRWENDDEIWMFDTQNFKHWKSL